MKEQVTIIDNSGDEIKMYLQERGSCVSTVSPYENSSWKTEKNVFNSSIKEFAHVTKDPNKEYFDTPQLTMEDWNNSSSVVTIDNNYDSYDDDDFNTSNCSDDWVSNCDGSDIPDHIDPSTAYFDEDGNYSGGSYIDLNDD